MPAPRVPTLAEVDQISAVADPVVRNLQITHCYHELALVLAAPEVGYSVIKLLSAMEQMRLQFPERMPVGFEPLFDT